MMMRRSRSVGCGSSRGGTWVGVWSLCLGPEVMAESGRGVEVGEGKADDPGSVVLVELRAGEGGGSGEFWGSA